MHSVRPIHFIKLAALLIAACAFTALLLSSAFAQQPPRVFSPLDPEERQAAPPPEETALSLSLAYYDRCTDGAEDVDDILQMSCACMAEQVRTRLSAAEMLHMAYGQGGQAPGRERFLTLIVAPCMQYEGRALAYTNCSEHRGYQMAARNEGLLHTMCDCLADKMAEYLEEAAPHQVAAMLVANPALDDPLEAVMTSRSYIREHETQRRACTVYAYGNAPRP